MFENIASFLKKIFNKTEQKENSKVIAKERLHLALVQDRANVSADFLDLMRQEIIEVIKKYIDVDEEEIDVRLTNQTNGDGTNGAPALYANIPIISIKNESKKDIIEKSKNVEEKTLNDENKKEEKVSEKEEEKEEKEEVQEKTEAEDSQEEVEAEENKKEESKA